MTEKEFLKETENFVYKEVAKNTNLILGKDKTASLSTGLFLKLPIEIKLEKTDKPIPKLYKELKSFRNYFGAYTKMEDSATVYFTFMYHTEKDLNAISNHLHRHGIFFAFVYLHEIQHILRKHITSSYETMMMRIAKDIPEPQVHHLTNIAEDHAINYSLKDLFVISPSKQVRNTWPSIEAIGQYDESYHEKKMSDIEILKDLLKRKKLPTNTPISANMCKVSCDGKDSIEEIDPGAPGKSEDTGDGDKADDKGKKPGKIDKCDTTADDLDQSLADLSESLQDIITSNTKGTAAGDLFADLFAGIKVETGWFKKIKSSFKRKVYYMTHDYTTNWANLNNTFRRIYKSPKKHFVDDKVNIVLSVDHSGSMATEDLQKLLYLMESESSRIGSLTVLIHDTRIVKEFVLESEYDIGKSPEFKEALATRYVSGGTSHDCVFNHIQNEMKFDDPSKVIYMSFSDNYSDIEQTVFKYPIMRKMTNYWICAGATNPVKAPGENIMMV